MMKKKLQECHKSRATSPTQTVIHAKLFLIISIDLLCIPEQLKALAPRYCPSIEDKVVRFADKERHQIFLEPEGLTTNEVYVNGVSSSLPFDVQLRLIHSIAGLEHAEIMRPAYAIEYDYVISGQLYPSLETKLIEGLYFAGQINGTTGYEEAAGQGLIAGINAASQVLQKDPFILKRSESYIGVMIDELITKDLDEPYRMFTSRAEHRLLLRQDNADLRLREYGFTLGLITNEQYQKLLIKKNTITEQLSSLEKKFVQLDGKGFSLAQLLCRPEYSYDLLMKEYPGHLIDHGHHTNTQIELLLKYAGYIQRQQIEVAKLDNIENTPIPREFDFSLIKGLRNEAREKLSKKRPATLGQASRMSGISPADISVLMVALTASRKRP